jgi:hypothetical protein
MRVAFGGMMPSDFVFIMWRDSGAGRRTRREKDRPVF